MFKTISPSAGPKGIRGCPPWWMGGVSRSPGTPPPPGGATNVKKKQRLDHCWRVYLRGKRDIARKATSAERQGRQCGMLTSNAGGGGQGGWWAIHSRLSDRSSGLGSAPGLAGAGAGRRWLSGSHSGGVAVSSSTFHQFPPPTGAGATREGWERGGKGGVCLPHNTLVIQRLTPSHNIIIP